MKRKTFGHYEVLDKLGSGGMGEVYRAKDLELGREVAIKVLRKEIASEPDGLKRFEREARTASALNHPNIATIYHIGEHEGTRYIAMELVEGQTLRELLNECPLSTKKTLALAKQIVAGLAKAHGASIVHRDLKPENFMVTEDGLVKILDFGLAKLIPQSSDIDPEMATMTKATRQGTILGTVQYMSPEQAAGRAVDYRSDQFAFGSVLYEMLTGRLAFGKETVPQTLAAIIEGEPEPISKLNDEAPDRSVMRYKGSDKPLVEIAEELDVDAIVEGSVLRIGERVRIAAQLIDPETNQALWADSYERDLQDVLLLQSEVAQAIAAEIQVAVTPEESERLASARPVNPEAHEAYLKGMFHWQRLTPADLEAALAYFDLALEKDPDYALAYAGIGQVWGGRRQRGDVPSGEATPMEKAAVLKALELDDSLAEAHHALALHETWGEWDWPSGERARAGHRAQPQLCGGAGLLLGLPDDRRTSRRSDGAGRASVGTGPAQRFVPGALW